MPPHTDNESKISIVLEGSLIEKVKESCVEAKRNFVVVKPNHTVHENLFGHRGATLLTINFHRNYPVPDDLNTWHWFADPRLSFSTYKLWYSAKAVRNDKQLNRCLDEFIQSLKTFQAAQPNNIPAWLLLAAELLRLASLDSDTINDISERLKVSRVHLSRSFKKHYSIPAIKYRHYVRFSNTLYCLAATNKSLADVSYECGFSDQSQMSRLVLKETGYTPQALRLLLQKL
jgi:AraC family transcriptional regulator